MQARTQTAAGSTPHGCDSLQRLRVQARPHTVAAHWAYGYRRAYWQEQRGDQLVVEAEPAVDDALGGHDGECLDVELLGGVRGVGLGVGVGLGLGLG